MGAQGESRLRLVEFAVPKQDSLFELPFNTLRDLLQPHLKHALGAVFGEVHRMRLASCEELLHQLLLWTQQVLAARLDSPVGAHHVHAA